jgi:hypothetical protein
MLNGCRPISGARLSVTTWPEFAELYHGLSAKLTDLFVRMQRCDHGSAAIDGMASNAFDNEHRRLGTVERRARGDTLGPTLLPSVQLPDFKDARVLQWPPRQPSMAAAYAAVAAVSSLSDLSRPRRPPGGKELKGSAVRPGDSTIDARFRMRATLERRRAYHEAAHACAAVFYGLPVAYVTIEPDHPHMRHARIRRERGFRADAYAVTALAGNAGEDLKFGPAGDDSDFIDRKNARSYLSEVYPKSEIGFLMSISRNSAESLVRSQRREIEIIADALLRRGRLTGSEVARLLA